MRVVFQFLDPLFDAGQDKTGAAKIGARAKGWGKATATTEDREVEA